MRWLISVRRLFVTNSLRFHLLSRSLMLLAVLLLFIGVSQFLLMKDFIYKNRASSIQSQIMTTPPNVWEQIKGNSLSSNEERFRFPFLFLQDSTLAFIDTTGKYTNLTNVDAIQPPRLTNEEYEQSLSRKHELNYRIFTDSTGQEQLVVLQRVEGRGGVAGLVQISVATKPLNDVLIRQLTIFLTLSLLALSCGVLLFIPVLRKTLVPLSNIVEAVEQIDAGKLDTRFPSVQGQLEIDRLAASFNGMLVRLESSFEAEKEAKEQMRRFVADASHELRTPLTSIHGFLEVLLRGAMNQPEQLQRSLKSMHTESERMNKLVQDLLLLAKLDRSPHILLSEESLDVVMMEMEDQLVMLAGERKVHFRLTPNCRCLFNEDKMKQVILNLFHNAVQHTDVEQGVITLSLMYGPKGGVRLEIEDNGSGISEEHLPYVFDRFYRSDTSRTRKYGGAGLGLSITSAIVEVHGGTLSVTSKEGKGSVFTVWLPGVS
ncbi:two-component system OmpR family sensor kinase [Paenibacillus sp. DS2015]|uniref:sensor histidine kinase n=1 Tax=Paenibacillus sp. DS2015 TaxID=3373917 RepID=UPI003D2434FA